MTLDTNDALRLARQCLPNTKSLEPKDVKLKSIARLWGGMGFIYVVAIPSRKFIVKQVIMPSGRLSFGDQRKAESYQVEAIFYQNIAKDLIEQGLSLPEPYYVEKSQRSILICMSYLPARRSADTKGALTWLATLHALTWGEVADEFVDSGLQSCGSYWHLDTRPDEHQDMPNRGWEGRLKRAARAIDERLKRDPMQCIIHGDAKEANILQQKDGSIAFCDFQYCGKGPPSKDLAYFLCSSEEIEDEFIAFYYDELCERLSEDQQPSLSQLKDSLDLALADFARFMSGWGYWGCDVSAQVCNLLDRLDGGSILESEDAYRDAMIREYG